MEEYSDAHRHFLQALMSRHVLLKTEARQLFLQACKRINLEPDLDKFKDEMKAFLLTINAELQPLGLEISHGRTESDGSTFYTLLNRRGGAETLACAAYDELQLQLLQQVIQEIVTSTRGDISSSTALNLVDKLPKKVSRAAAQAMLTQLEADRWLELTAGRVALHTRCILELAPYLRQHYADHVRLCGLCNMLCVRGVNCEECEARYHLHCVKGMGKNTGAAVRCKKCRSQLELP